MKIFILFLLLFVVGCDSIFDECSNGTAKVPTIRIASAEWEKHFGITYEQIKAKHEGTYQTEEEVWYKGEKRILTFYVKMDSTELIQYSIAAGNTECADDLSVPVMVLSDIGIIYKGNCNKSYLYTSMKAFSQELSLSNSEYQSFNKEEGITKYILTKKISNEIPAELDWSYTSCDDYRVCE